MMDRPAAQELLEIAVEVAREAADTASRMRSEGVSVAATKSTVTDVVTAADRAVERQISEALRRLRPDDAMLGEEYGAAAPGSVAAQVRWIVDPIDGTVNYLYGLGHSAVSIAAEVEGQVVAGVVRNIHTGEEWTATLGGGAWRAGRRLRCSAETDLGQTLVITGFGYDPARRAHQARVVAELIPQVRDIRRLGAAAIDLCLVAEGRADAYYEKGLAVWDQAAGALVATEAGLRVDGLRGRAPGPDMVVAAPAALFTPLHDRLVELDADGGP
ncbi:inositol monophosphatase family protein [Micromonospora sp. DT229]|uniref:inositol monophosphatase family protein n=1 Tax=Micromonospora sp. DT229 TaxID=3393430 RepID=UPI003CE74953